MHKSRENFWGFLGFLGFCQKPQKPKFRSSEISELGPGFLGFLGFLGLWGFGPKTPRVSGVFGVSGPRGFWGSQPQRLSGFLARPLYPGSFSGFLGVFGVFAGSGVFGRMGSGVLGVFGQKFAKFFCKNLQKFAKNLQICQTAKKAVWQRFFAKRKTAKKNFGTFGPKGQKSETHSANFDRRSKFQIGVSRFGKCRLAKAFGEAEGA